MSCLVIKPKTFLFPCLNTFKHIDIGFNLHVLIFFLSFVYAYALQSLPLLEYKDRINYLNYASYSDVIFFMYLNRGLPVLIPNEPVWLLTNIVLSLIFTPETSLRIIIFSSAFIFFLYFYKDKSI